MTSHTLIADYRVFGSRKRCSEKAGLLWRKLDLRICTDRNFSVRVCRRKKTPRDLNFQSLAPAASLCEVAVRKIHVLRTVVSSRAKSKHFQFFFEEERSTTRIASKKNYSKTAYTFLLLFSRLERPKKSELYFWNAFFRYCSLQTRIFVVR